MELRRGVHPDTLAAMQGVFHPVAMVYLDWPGTPVYAHTGAGILTWGGHDWGGVGDFGQLDMPSEQTGMQAAVAAVTLIAPADSLFELHGVEIRGMRAQIWAAVVTERGGHVIIGEPLSLFQGYMDGRRFPIAEADGVRAQSVQIQLSAGPSARVTASPYHSREDQERAYPGDTAGRLVERSRDWSRKLRW